ncbi:MAG: hypothetical protein FJX46_02230 [Alphaproteobacteria bacterium]|nr:hypothetical protein [Alphaproteobacteria bacterium]
MKRALVVLLLAACTPATQAPPPPPASAAAGEPRQTVLHRTESRLSILLDQSLIKERRQVELPDRYREYVAIEGGFVRYDRLKQGTWAAGESNRAALKRIVDTDEVREAAGAVYREAEVKDVERALGRLSYILVTTPRARCFLFATQGPSHELAGARCRPADDPGRFNLEFEMLSFLGRLRLDEGAAERRAPG